MELAERYRIERELGRGGMATVYLAQDLKHPRKVALKVLDPELSVLASRERFQREIEIASRLTHPHIVPLFDSGNTDGRPFYVMPYIEGETLRRRLEREPVLPVDEALRLAREIASALGHAHHQGLVHRDIKPENILLSDGIALVADFGIARPMDASGADAGTLLMTQGAAAIGTPRYMSPEQVTGAEIDGRADLYALSVMLYEMLAGQPPFVAERADTLLRLHLTAEPRPVTELRPSVPASLAAVIARGLAKDPADRYATAARFAEALAAAAQGTPAAAPAARVARVPHNLPRQRTHFIGRADDLARCARLLETSRLITLTGIGGSGKTRVALELAASMLDGSLDGIWFVDLAPLTEETRVPEAVAAVLGVREEPGRDLTDGIVAEIGARPLLLLLDNCEHLLGASAALADRLLSGTDRLRLVATSREGLGVEGEHLVALRSLSLPVAGADAASSEAVQLFVDRARSVVSTFALDPGSAPLVAEICRRLDGIPLAIELAAARVKLLSLSQIRDKLDDRFRLLTGGRKSALSRHQTLRATLQWSYDQLSGEEQELLRALSVFAGGATLAAVAQVPGQGDEFESLELLGRLVDKSLLVVDREGAGEPRYRLLETVRQYARERLAEAGEADRLRERHLAYFLRLAERAYAERFTREELWAAELAREHDNLRAALESARHTSPERGLELAGALTWFWHARSHLVEASEHLTALIAQTAAAPARPARARALLGAARVLSWRGDTATALPRMEESLAMWRGLGEREEVASALEGIGWVQILAGEDEQALVTFEECYAIQLEQGDPVHVNRARVALTQALVAVGEVARARALSVEIVAFAAARGDRRNEHFGWHFLADAALIEGRCEESLVLYRKSLLLAQAIGDLIETAFEVEGVAMSLAGLGQHERAVFLSAASRAEWERVGADIHVRFWDALVARYIAPAERALPASRVAQIRDEARGASLDTAIQRALENGEDATGRADQLLRTLTLSQRSSNP